VTGRNPSGAVPVPVPAPAAPAWHPALLWEPAGDAVRCTLCPERCRLEPGATGPCGVRRAVAGDDGRVELRTATLATTVAHLDAVERKPLYHYRPGRRVLTLAAPGCTFRCNYCVNHRVSQYGRVADVEWRAGPVDVAGVVAAAAREGADVALSYTEPSLAPELTAELVAAGREVGVGVLWKSNGYLTPESLELAAAGVAAVNIDLKAPDESSHRRLTGAPLAPVLDAVRGFVEAGVWVEVSTPLIPPVFRDEGAVRAVAEFLSALSPDIPWHLLRFTPTFRMQHHPPTRPAALERAFAVARESGLRYVYVERALGEAGRQTRCPKCQSIVIHRGLWALERNLLAGGRCPGCATPISGRWEA
jgi:pyruvate formate lyase activating enzyme